MSPSPATSTSNGAGTGSVWESRVRVDEDKGGFKVFSGDEDEQLDVEVEEEEDVESPKSGRSGESNQRESKRTIIALADKKKTSRSTSGNHSLSTTQKSRLLQKKQTGSVQLQSKNSRSNQDGKEKVAAANDRRGPIPIKRRQITKTTGRSIAIKSKSSCNGAEVLSETSSRSFSDESRRKLESASTEKNEAAVANGSSSALIEAPTITGNGGARDSESASEATKSAQLDDDSGRKKEETKTTELNDSEETSESEIEIRAVMMETDAHSEDENLNEKNIPVCLGEEGTEVDNEDELKVEKKIIGSTGSDFDVEETKKNALQLRGPISRQALSSNLSPSQVGSAKPNSLSKTATGSSSNKLPAPIRKQHPTFPRPISGPTARVSEECQQKVVPQHCSQLQSLIDLVMWIDVSRSAFVFGLGTFLIISSSYSTNLDISLVSVTSYLGLIYLAVTFMYKSVINKDTVTRENYHAEMGLMVGEQDVVRVMRLILPYVNESLQKLKALFSGDPAMTMKVAVVLFVMARCGGSITIGSMMKLGFFTVFTIPKLLSSHSTQITRYGTFWLRRFRDAWKSCLHKKAVAITIFTIFWSLCSVTARIWAAFMLFVAVRYYHQSTMGMEWLEPVTANKSNAYGQKQSNEPPLRRSVGRAMAVDTKKTKGDPQG